MYSPAAAREVFLKTGSILVVLGTVALAAPATGQVTPQTTSQATSDNDVVQLGGRNWRLHGIDLPDAQQVCADGWRAGEESRAALQRLTGGAKLECRNTGKDQYSRPVATCLVNGEDLGETLVRQGMAWASLRYTWRYMLDDWIAWFNGAGLYAHKCEKPWEWRARTGDGKK